MSKVRNFSEIAPNIAFPEFNFYELYYSTFEKSELGRIKNLLPLREMADNFGLVRKSMSPKLGRKSFFTPEGKVALMFMKMYTGLSCTKLLLEGIEKSYAMMCELNSRLGIHRPRTKFLDVQKANLTYRKQRKHSRSQTRKITRRLLDLLGKILKEIREIERDYENVEIEGTGHCFAQIESIKLQSLFKSNGVEKNKLHFNMIESQLCDLGVQVIWY